MRPVAYLFIFAILFLIFKAFFLDAYIVEHYNNDANNTIESNITVKPTVISPEPIPKPQVPTDVSTMAPEKHEKQEMTEDKKMPLDKLGDSLSKHIKL